MSASRTPTFSPRSRSPSARLTAVVDLPTPPLPEATAMMASTPGMPGCALSAGCAWGRRGRTPTRSRLGPTGLFGRERNQRRLHPGHRLDRVLGALAHRLPSLDRGGIDGERE